MLDIINVDRWQLSHQPNPEYPPSDKGEDRLPMQVSTLSLIYLGGGRGVKKTEHLENGKN